MLETHTVELKRFEDETVYTIGTYDEKLAGKIAVKLAGRPDVRAVWIRDVRR